MICETNKKRFVRIFIIAFILSLIELYTISASGWYYGTTHIHTGYSSWAGYDGNILTTGDNCPKETLDYSGYTVSELEGQAKNSNLFWLSFTDHSYCLDSSEFNTIGNDCQDAQDSSFSCLWGEELSVYDTYEEGIETLCDNLNTKTAHLGAHGISNFITQSPSGVWCPDNPSAQTGISSINSGGGISILDHPHTTSGVWDFDSIQEVSNEKGIEIWNGDWEGLSYNEEAKNTWRDKLLNGEKVYAFGGTDDHDGITIKNYNLVYVSGSLTHSNLKAGLKEGINIVSNNGYVIISITSPRQGYWTGMGDELDVCSGDQVTIKMDYNVVNSCTLRLYWGLIGGNEYLVYSTSVSGSDYKTTSRSISSGSYFRAECISSDGMKRIYTNPIWLNVDTAYCPQEDCDNGVDDDQDGYTDCRDADCTQGTKSQNGFCCGSGCSVNGGSCYDASTSGFTCSDGNCNTYSEACQNGELESNLVCSGTSLSCSGGNCEYNFGAPRWCDEITPSDSACENSPGSYNELACELSGTDCDYDAEYSCGAPGPQNQGCDERKENDCSENSRFQCEWQGTYSDNVVEECESGCGAISQCDEKSIGYDYASCTTGGQTYFADECSSICGGQDREDNICRSSAFASGCTADAGCNGVIAGTNDCSATCTYGPPEPTGDTFNLSNAGNSIAIFDSAGNLFLKNTLKQSATPADTADDEFLLRDDSNTVVAKINSTGYMEIKGTLAQNQGSLTDPPGDDFLIKDGNNVVAYINESGYMFLKGSLYENYG